MARRRSNTVGNKVKDQESSQERQLHGNVCADPLLIKIGMRRTNKPIRYIEILSIIQGSKLFDTIQKQFYIDSSKQVLFIRGQKIQQNQQSQRRTFTLTSKDIIHIHNMEQICKSLITISLQILNSDHIKIRQIKVTTNPYLKIFKVIQEALIFQLEHVSSCQYAQSGRFLDLSRTFVQEAVENQSILLVVDRGRNDEALGKLEEREIQIIQSFKKLMKRPSMNMDMTQAQQTHNFKKKPKCHVYRTIYMPDSKQMIWEQDSSSSYSSKMMIKKIAKNRPNNGLQKLQSFKELSNKTLFASSKKGEQNFQKTKSSSKKQQATPRKKLAFSQILLPRTQKSEQKAKAATNLKTPPLIMDDLFQEIQEMQFGEHEVEEIQVQEPSDNQLNSSAPLTREINNLTMSIGKSKGAFIPIIPRTTIMDDDSDDDDEEEGHMEKGSDSDDD